METAPLGEVVFPEHADRLALVDSSGRLGPPGGNSDRINLPVRTGTTLIVALFGARNLDRSAGP